MTDVSIRQYKETDLESCRTLWVDLTQRHRDIYGDPTIGGKDPGRYFDEHLARVGEQNIWVAENEDRVVGMVGLIQEDEPEVEPIIVSQEYRNKQIGTKLLEYVIGKARERGLRYLSIRPVARNGDAISLFHGTGFNILGHIEMFMDLNPEPRISWKPGPELLGHTFEH